MIFLFFFQNKKNRIDLRSPIKQANLFVANLQLAKYKRHFAAQIKTLQLEPEAFKNKQSKFFKDASVELDHEILFHPDYIAIRKEVLSLMRLFNGGRDSVEPNTSDTCGSTESRPPSEIRQLSFLYSQIDWGFAKLYCKLVLIIVYTKKITNYFTLTIFIYPA